MSRSMNILHAQYLVSDDPEVIEVIQTNAANRDYLFTQMARPWAEERGFSSVALSLDGNRVTGLPGQPEGFGQWTKPKYGVSKPFKTNKAEVEIMRALAFDKIPVPGVPAMVDSVSNHDGSRYWMYPRPFVWKGRAWIGLGHAPDPDRYETQRFGEQWRECLSSEFHAARDAAIADAKQEEV